ncbi:hypothetical protein FB470_004706 [Amycolatopsis thermophila]|uniref:Uncharacterized protein n=1 Tax=Amycolatopsis thermophila TaxID=206084 RepID=A0ABU0EZH7_9PSEU|nr:hypothetical protein [Amycolatopsis thermophila]
MRWARLGGRSGWFFPRRAGFGGRADWAWFGVRRAAWLRRVRTDRSCRGQRRARTDRSRGGEPRWASGGGTNGPLTQRPAPTGQRPVHERTIRAVASVVGPTVRPRTDHPSRGERRCANGRAMNGPFMQWRASSGQRSALERSVHGTGTHGTATVTIDPPAMKPGRDLATPEGHQRRRNDEHHALHEARPRRTSPVQRPGHLQQARSLPPIPIAPSSNTTATADERRDPGLIGEDVGHQARSPSSRTGLAFAERSNRNRADPAARRGPPFPGQ